MVYNLRRLCGRCDDKSGCTSTHVSFVSDPQLSWRCWFSCRNSLSHSLSLCVDANPVQLMKCWQTTHTHTHRCWNSASHTCNKWMCTYCIVSPHCVLRHHLGIDTQQLEYFDWYVKPADSRSAALCKRCNNSDVKGNMATEKVHRLWHICTHILAQVIILWRLLMLLKL